jgi:uncharacterized membrane protein HdeD (DUF308 family)
MLFQELNKIKRSSIIMSITLMALGLVMAMCPEKYINSLISTLGCALIIVSIVMILEYLNSKKVLFNTVLLTLAIILGLVGLAVLVFENDILRILGWSFGVLLVIQGIETTYNALMYVRPSKRSGWWLLVFLGAVLIAVGVLIFLNPWWDTPRALLKIIGLTLLFDAAVGILRLVFIWPIEAEAK